MHDFQTEFDEQTPGAEAIAAQVAEMLASGETTFLLAGGVDGAPVGLAELRFRRSKMSGALDAYLEELYVAPPLRGEGLGRALLEAAIELARERGATHMDLGTSEDDVAARRLYESAGFINREGGPDGPLMLFYEREL
jgi:ribosomal protein S18 acetylase RimI-like enzyme